jgi:hypothetical protein
MELLFSYFFVLKAFSIQHSAFSFITVQRSVFGVQRQPFWVLGSGFWVALESTTLTTSKDLSASLRDDDHYHGLGKGRAPVEAVTY